MTPKTLTYLLVITNLALGQLLAQDPYAEVLETYNKQSIPYIHVSEFNKMSGAYTLLDARELEEYAVSHLKNAVHVGYKNFNLEKVSLELGNPDQTIVVYCSIGVRSEDVAEALKAKGYKNVFNLYGGIFNWVSEGKPVYNLKKKVTDSIHAYSKNWAPYVTRGIKVYE